MDLTSFTDTHLCLSGGAVGADLQWGMCAGKLGHNVIHWSFEGHSTLAPSSERVVLTNEQLIEANKAVSQAAIGLGKAFPKNKFALPLIQRNYYQVAWSQALYGVGFLEGNQVVGGTSWAVQMFLNRKSGLPLYFYEQTGEFWLQWDYEGNQWETGDPPQPTGIWAGIGTRDLTKPGKEAIRTLMGYTPDI